jgi:NAD+ synthase (glutamine-hydrolysing)
VDADPAQHLCRAGRRHGAAEPVRQQHHHRQGRYRNDLCAAQSGKCIAAYLYSAAGPGESTTDLAWDGHAVIFENNRLLAESERFPRDEQLVTADIDLELLQAERLRVTSFSDSAQAIASGCAALRRVRFELDLAAVGGDLLGPWAPATDRALSLRAGGRRGAMTSSATRPTTSRCTAWPSGWSRPASSASSSASRAGSTPPRRCLVAARTMDRLGLPRGNILAYTMPGFATSAGTRDNALR